MQFGPNQLRRFKSTDGAYSSVTAREHEDSQITLTDHEKEIVLDHFGTTSITRGSIGKAPAQAQAQASKKFLLYPDGNEIRLNINFPKKSGTELRLYLNSEFKPEPDFVVFIFPRDGQLWIGAMQENAWRAGSADVISDNTDSTYQNLIQENDEVKITTLKERDVYVRDRKIALASMENAGYVCEFDNSHHLFTSRFSNRPYLEAHHLIPMEFQPDFKTKSLDIVENVFCLCPNCHRAVHHAVKDNTRQILDELTAARNPFADFKLTIQQLHAMYGVEDIV